MQVAEDVTGGTLQQVVDETVAAGSKIECDGYRSYRNLSGVTLDAKKYETGYLHWLHKAISNLKALLLGTYHGRCTQLQAYLDEFCFRFNRRKTGDRSSCAWQELSLHLVPSCVKPISKFQNMTTSAQRQKTPRDPTSGIAGVRGEDLRFRPLSGALGGFPADGREKGRQHGEESRTESGGGAGRSGRV